MDNNFQRVGSLSNSHVGREFEKTVQSFFLKRDLKLLSHFKIPIGVNGRKRPHEFDMGAEQPDVLVECKSHTWTSGANVPSAKITTWDQAMYYFSISPKNYRMIFCALKDERSTTGETLAAYYIRLKYHLIPENVEFWEFDATTGNGERLA